MRWFGRFKGKRLLNIHIRPAVLEDVDVITALIERSVRGLQANDYTPEQLDGALGSVFGVDRQLIRDGSYFVVEAEGEAVACGGWSRRRTLFGADAVSDRDDQALTPGVDAARIRAFFVDPGHARQGIGGKLLDACEDAARAYGFTEAELGATLTGVPLYTRYGYRAVERYDAPLPNGLGLPIVRMTKSLTAPPAAT
jgi:GNAT superfamily N-acetyltransferase